MLLGIVAISSAWFYKYSYLENKNKSVEVVKEEVAPKVEAEIPKSVSLVFVGDVMLDRGIRKKVDTKFNGDYEKVFELVKEGIRFADITSFNLEGPVSDKGSNVGSVYSFRMATSVLPVLANVGFDVAMFSNNHIGDWGKLAFEDTIQRTRDANISVVGAGLNYEEVSEPLVIEKNNIKIGFLSFSDVGPSHMKAGTSTSGIILLSDPNLEDIIKNAKSKCDKLIVGIHWGDEYKNSPTERQQEFGHKIIDWGALVVVGHHPHVIEPAEKYNGGLIVYSLGNFVFDQYFSKETMEGNVLYLTFTENGVEEYALQKIEIDNNFRPFFVD